MCPPPPQLFLDSVSRPSAAAGDMELDCAAAPESHAQPSPEAQSNCTRCEELSRQLMSELAALRGDIQTVREECTSTRSLLEVLVAQTQQRSDVNAGDSQASVDGIVVELRRTAGVVTLKLV